jgi:hypothetical protein
MVQRKITIFRQSLEARVGQYRRSYRGQCRKSRNKTHVCTGEWTDSSLENAGLASFGRDWTTDSASPRSRNEWKGLKRLSA